MGLIRKWLKEPKSRRLAHDENVLVISDIHLGEDILADGPEHLYENIRVLNKELAGFVRSHTDTPVNGRRWRLIINGDLFDFVKVTLKPDPEEALRVSDEVVAHRPVSVAPRTVDDVVRKLERILDIHRPLFRELACFLLAGNDLTICEGNHDVEFFFEEVRRTLEDFIIAEARKVLVAEGRHRKMDETVAALRHQMVFRRWFEASAGRYHIEHGHQHDALSSFEYNLVPTEVHGKQIAMPMALRVIPYFADLVGDFSTHGVEKRGFFNWMRYAMHLGPRIFVALLRTYVACMRDLLGDAGKKRKRELKALSLEHKRRLAAYTQSSPYGLETLQQLDALKAMPAEYSVLKMSNMFFVDRLLVVILTIGAVIGGAIVGGRMGDVVVVSALIAGIIISWGLGRIRIVRTDIALRRAAARIADVTGARYVVFGHSHKPEMTDLREHYGAGRFDEAAFYINCGSWVTREILRGTESNGMTYVEITPQGCYLKRWRGTHATPALLGTSRGRRREDAEQVEG